ncbi:hypothetical protein DPMN_056604 [Dreissena polymorpha]|uniref:Uncharacterized protein n=1 Tax=Dreissena polymorpha TaxID=45954 RepID=A0A9D4HTC1_DREPO|nr:hypothetical protein DPMN_056604 [Dreissena polymorpha]
MTVSYIHDRQTDRHTSLASTRGPQPLWTSRGSLTESAPLVVRTWPERCGGNISNLVSSRLAIGEPNLSKERQLCVEIVNLTRDVNGHIQKGKCVTGSYEANWSWLCERCTGTQSPSKP